jgi:hypothetical protein
MVIDIYMTDPNMTGGRPSEKRIKFRSVHRNGSSNFNYLRNSHLEIWKSPLNSENYFELISKRGLNESRYPGIVRKPKVGDRVVVNGSDFIKKNITESEDDLEWAEEIVNGVNNMDATNLKGKAWEIILPGPEEDFIEAQKWAFKRGFKWHSTEELLDTSEYSYSALCTIGSIFHDNIRNSTLTYGGSGNCNRETVLKETVRIAKDNARTNELYVFDWDSNKKEAILTEVVTLNSLKESEEDEFDWVPNEVDLNDHRVLYSIIEDTLKNTNFKIVKDGKIYHIEDEYGDIYFYIPETDFNLPFIYHEIKDGIQFLTFEDDNEMLPYYQKLMDLLRPLYKNNIDKLFKPIKESEDDDLEWAFDTVKQDPLEFHDKELMIDVYDLTVDHFENFCLKSGIIISNSALDIYAEETCAENEYGERLKIDSSNVSIKNALTTLFYDVLNIDFKILINYTSLFKGLIFI